MIIGTVCEAIRSKRGETLPEGLQFLEISTEGRTLVAADRLGAKSGDKVLVLSGPGAARLWQELPVDAAVVAVVENGCGCKPCSC
ncbi:MAG: ethanolamine utilization protein EutN [Firmicutes bacterium]|nr:ethanolamine utilization protein EutN [Bacillota bacterium]